MAKISLVQTKRGPRNYYDVNAAVGPGALNRRDDVLLVQYFLHENFKSPIFLRSPFPGGELTIDGKAGQQTFSAISHYQNVLKKDGRSIAADGRVDPPLNEQIRGSILNTQYTILFLNLGFERVRPQDWPRVSQAGDCPSELRELLREPTFITNGKE
jgi:hypothetical protein